MYVSCYINSNLLASCCMSSNSILLQISITPLHVACENGHTETAQMLIDRGADVNKEDSVCYIV